MPMLMKICENYLYTTPVLHYTAILEENYNVARSKSRESN